MEISELREGSIVMRKGRITRDLYQHALSIDDISIDDIWRMSKSEKGMYKYEPLEITKDNLIKLLGFGENDEHEVSLDLGELISIHYDYHFKRLFLQTSIGFDIPLNHKYIHQIQNIIQSL